MKRLLTILLLVTSHVFATTHYVSLAGSAANNGLTPATSWNYAKAYATALPAGDTLLFNRGDVFYGPLRLWGGSAGNVLVYGAYGTGANPKITGLTTLATNTWVLSSGNIYYAPVTATQMNMVVLNGKAQAIGRYPKTGYLHISHSSTSYITDTTGGLTGAPSWVGAELVMRKYRWILDRHIITGQTSSPDTLKFRNSSTYGNDSSYAPVNLNGYFIQNSINCLTQRGDWYFDSTNQRLYMHFGTGIPKENVIQASTVPTLATFNTIGYMEIDDIDFEGASANAIDMYSSSNLTLNRCNFTKMAGNGVHGNTATNINIQGGSFTDCLNNGVFIELAGNNTTLNGATFNNIGNVQGMGRSGDGSYIGISIAGNNTTITNNTVTNTGYHGINFSGDNVLVEHNTVDTYCKWKDDGAGIYTFMGATAQRSNRVIRYNTILNGTGAQAGTEAYNSYEAFGKAAGVYLDFASDVKVNNNTIAHGGWAGVFINGNGRDTILNNTVYDFAQQQFYLYLSAGNTGVIRNMVVKNNSFISKTATQKASFYQIRALDTIARFGVIDSNYYARPIDDNLTMRYIKDYGSYSDVTYNLANWKTQSAVDAASNKSSITISNVSNQRFDYNNTATTTTVNFGQGEDVKGNIFSGSESLLPYTGNVVLATSSQTTGKYYFANSGDDAFGTGTITYPFASISRLNTLTTGTGDSVFFNRGDVFASNLPIASNLNYAAYGTGANPKITGFTTLNTWTNEGNGVYSAPLSVGYELNEVEFNGVEQQMGRYPNTGWRTIQSATGNTSITDATLTGSWVGAELVLRKSKFIIERQTITSGTTTLNYSTTSNYFLTPGNTANNSPVANNGYFIQGSLATLDSLGEWYYNPGASKLYVYFGTNNPNNYMVKASTIDKLVNGSGNSNISFSNVDFEGANSFGFFMSTCNNIRFTNCNMSFMGGYGIYSTYGSNCNNIKYNGGSFHDMNNDAVLMYGDSCKFANISFSNIAMSAGMGWGNNGNYEGINIGGNSDTLLRSTLTNIGFNAVAFTGGANVIDSNFVNGFCSVKEDGGAFYINNSTTNLTYVRNNIAINGIGAIAGSLGSSTDSLAEGFYADNNTQYLQFSNNTAANIQGGGTLLNEANHISVLNNTFYNCLSGIIMSQNTTGKIRNETVTGNSFIAANANQYVVKFISNALENMTLLGTFNNNYYARPIDDNNTFRYANNSAVQYTNFAGWKTLIGGDAASSKSLTAITNVLKQRFDYNNTASTIVIPVGLGKDIRGNTVSGTESLAPFTGNPLFSTSVQTTGKYYFANSGDDLMGDGTINYPLASISKFNSLTLSAGDSVFFKRGDAFYGTLTINNNGTTLNKIYIGAYGSGNRPTITGLTPLSSWTSVGNGLYTSTLPSYPTNPLTLVTLQDTIQAKGRYPKANLGDASYFTIDSLGANTSTTGAPRDFRSRGIAFIPNFLGAELVQRTEQWVFDRSIITTQTASKLSYSPEYSPDHPSFTYPSKIGHGFFFQNHFNACTQLGDWTYNNSTHAITMFFGNASPSSYAVQVATLDSLFTHNYHTNITIDNICFKGSNGNLVELDYANGIKLSNDSLIYAGQNGIDVSRANDKLNTNHDTITNCVIKNIINNAANLVESTNWQIDHSHFENAGLRQGMGLSGDGQYVGVFKVGANSVFELNEVDSVGYNGVWYTGNNTIVRKNHIHDYCMRKSDGGGIYSYGNTGSNIHIDSNIVHDGRGDLYGMSADFTNPYIGQIHGIYNDGNVNGVTETHNTSFNNSSSGIWFGSNTNITATNNTAYNNTTTQINGNEIQGSYTGMNITNNILFAKDSGQLIHQFLIPPTDFPGLHLDSNIYARPIWQPLGISNDHGYQIVPFSWGSYNDGSIIETTTAGGSFYSLDAWQTYSGLDAHSTKYNGSFTGPSDVSFMYNPTSTPMPVTLATNYYDTRGNHYSSGAFVIPAFTSYVLVRDTATYAPPPPPPPPPGPIALPTTCNFYGIAWRGTAHDNLLYAKTMKYTAVMYQNGMENDTLSNNLYFIFETPEGRPFQRVIDSVVSPLTTAQKTFYNSYGAVVNNKTSPSNLATGYMRPGTTQIEVHPDWQQQKVINYCVDSIFKLADAIEAVNPKFKFGGVAWDEPVLTGDFYRDSTHSAPLSYFSGGFDTTLILPGNTHEYATYSDGHAAFYKLLFARSRARNPNCLLMGEPYEVYTRWLNDVIPRSDKRSLTFNALSTEGSSYEIFQDTTILALKLNKREELMSTQPNNFEESINRIIATNTAVNYENYGWFGRFGGSGNMPNYQNIYDVPARLKLIRCLTNWENLNNTYNRSLVGGKYMSATAIVDSTVIAIIQPGTGKLFVVFNTTTGQYPIPAGKTPSFQIADGYFRESGATTDLITSGGFIKPKDGTVLGNGYIITFN